MVSPATAGHGRHAGGAPPLLRPQPGAPARPGGHGQRRAGGRPAVLVVDGREVGRLSPGAEVDLPAGPRAGADGRRSVSRGFAGLLRPAPGHSTRPRTGDTVLTELRVRDLGVIDDLTLRFGPGMTALTGETGAGKTLLVEALQLVLGDRAAPRPGPGRARPRRWSRPASSPARGRETETVLSRAMPGRRPVPGLGRRPDGPGHRPGRGRAATWSTSTASTTTSRCSAPAAQRRALDEFAGTDLGPRRRAAGQRGGARPQPGRPRWGRTRSGPASSTSCATRWPRSTAAAIDDPDEEEALRAEEERLADLSAHRQAAAARPGRAARTGRSAGGGARPGRAGRAAALAGRAAFAGWTTRLRRRPGRARRRGQRPAGGGRDLAGRPRDA